MRTYDVRNEFQGGYTARRTSTRFIVIHHAADHYPQTNGLDDVRAIKRWHTGIPPNGNGWPGIGYHIVLAEEMTGGPIARYNVSDLSLQRAHVWGRNHEALGICCATDFGKVRPAQKWIDALILVLHDLIARYPQAQIVGHKDITLPGHDTACPGDAWLRWKPNLLAALAPAPQPAPDPWLAWGTAYPLPIEQRGWGIPQIWAENARWLKEARSNPMYAVMDAQGDHNRFVVQAFQGGAIWGLDDQYQLIRFPRELP